jgi:hypothetical protein
MKQILFLITTSFFFFSSLQANTIRVYDNPPVEYTLSADTCDLLRPQLEAIKHWMEKFGERFTISKEHYQENLHPLTNKPQCEVDILPHIPDYMRTSLGKNPICRGPNCFNSVLVANKMLPHFRYTDGAELTFWLQSPYCREKSQGEPLEAGDIIAIREQAHGQWQEYHAFVYLTPELSYSKNGLARENAHQFQSYQKVLRIYDVPKECHSHRTLKERQSADQSIRACSKMVQAFDCKAPPYAQELFSKKEPPVPSSLPNALSAHLSPDLEKKLKNEKITGHFICNLECQISRLTWDNDIVYRPDTVVELHQKIKEQIVPMAVMVKETLDTIEKEERSIKGNWFKRLFAGLSDQQKEKIEALQKHKQYWISLKHQLSGTFDQWNYVQEQLK